MRTRTLQRWLLEYAVPPAALLALVVAGWEAGVRLGDVPAYLVPSPGQVCSAAWTHAAELGRATLLTGRGAVYGLSASLLVGTLAALVFSQSRLIQRAAWPYAIFLQTVPIIAIAPLLLKWFGTGMLGVSAVAFMISVFPIIAGGTAGLTSVDPNLLELFALHNASRWQTLSKLRLPNAIPQLVTGAKVSCGLSVIGSIVGETYAGAGDEFGLGYLIQLTSGQVKTDYAFAALFFSAALGVAMFAAVSLTGAAILHAAGSYAEAS